MFKVTKFGICVGSLAIASAAYGSVSFSIAAGTLRDSGGLEIDQGLIILAVDNDGDGFDLPDATNFLQGTDKEVARWDFSEGGGLDGEFLASKVLSTYNETDWTEDGALALFWYPALDKTDLVPGVGAKFGVFAPGATDHSTGDAWQMPGDNEHLYSLQFFAEGSLLSTVDYESEFAGAAALEEGDAFNEAAVIGSTLASQADPTVQRVEWSPAPATQQYRVERKQASAPDSDWKTVAYKSGASTFHEDDSIVPGLSFVYRVVAESGFGLSATGTTDAFQAARSVFINLAARGHIVPGSDIRPWTLLNAGIILEGNDPTKRMLGLGISDYNNRRFGNNWLADSNMLLDINGTVVAENDNWMWDDENTANADVLTIESAMDARSTPELPVDGGGELGKDSAILEHIALGPNLFKVTSADPGAAAGFAGVQVYDAEYEGFDNPPINDNRIVNLSTRGYLAENGTFNGSLIIDGDVPKEVLVLARGPALALKGTARVLDDPKLILKRGADVLLENETWDEPVASSLVRGLLAVETNIDRIRAAIVASGQVPDDHTLDAAMLVTLAPSPTEGYIFKIEASENSADPHGTVQIQINEVEME